MTLYIASIRHDGTDVWITSAHLTQQEAKAEIVRAAVAVGFSPESAHFDEFSDAADFLAAHDFDTRVTPAELSDTRGDRSDQTRHEQRSGERGREGRY